MEEKQAANWQAADKQVTDGQAEDKQEAWPLPSIDSGCGHASCFYFHGRQLWNSISLPLRYSPDDTVSDWLSIAAPPADGR